MRLGHDSHALPTGDVTASTTAVQGTPTVEEMDTAAAGVPGDAICFSRHFCGLQQNADCVTLHFTDGTTVRSRLVIGADGCFSKVRQETVADGPPDFAVRPRTKHSWNLPASLTLVCQVLLTARL